MQELTGRTAVITGAASGIGLAMAHRLGSAGMRLVLADVEGDALDRAAAELGDAGHDTASLVVDVRDLEQVRALEAFARDRFGEVNVLCNNAGVGAGGLIAQEDDIDLWHWVIDVNLWGVIHGCKVFLPSMISQDGPGHVVNTASMAGLGSAPMMGPYNVSKYGVVALSETLTKEMQMTGSGIGVSVLCPAFVRTRIAESGRNLPAELRADAPSDGSTDDGSTDDGSTDGGASDGGADGVSSVIAQLVEAGIAPETVAEAVHDAIVADRFWILTHEDAKQGVIDRARQIVDGVDPVVDVSF